MTCHDMAQNPSHTNGLVILLHQCFTKVSESINRFKSNTLYSVFLEFFSIEVFAAYQL